MSFLLSKGHVIEEFTVQFPIKNNGITQTYRVIRKDGCKGALKIFLRGEDFPQSLVGERGEIREIVNMSALSELKGVPMVLAQGHAENGDDKFDYMVSKYISGETLSEAVKRGKQFTPELSVFYCKRLAEIVHELHNNGFLHNEICLENIMIEYSDDSEELYLIDFGASTLINYKDEIISPNMNLNYFSIEALNGIFNISTDIYSLFSTIYRLTFSQFANEVDYSEDDDLNSVINKFEKRRKEKLNRPALANEKIENYFKLIEKGLNGKNQEILNSFNSVRQFDLREINLKKVKSKNVPAKPASSYEPTGLVGFEAIAGMENLKAKLKEEVLEALQNPDKFKQYRLAIPNGMLLYGPPGCGKTFFAKKFSEEAKMEYFHIRPSDLGSIYIHGSQEKIAKLFDSARENAPSIIFFDELDAILPTRDQSNHQSSSAEVNEFLSQMDNTGADGVFIIGATNRKELIDPAILRAGRLDYKILIPPPDFLARKAIFQLQLANRPNDGKLDFEELAHCTEGFVSSDLELIVNTAARKAMRENEPIKQEVLLEVIGLNEPSISKELLKQYTGENVKLDDGREFPGPTPIGFNINRTYS